MLGAGTGKVERGGSDVSSGRMQTKTRSSLAAVGVRKFLSAGETWDRDEEMERGSRSFLQGETSLQARSAH